jgi:N-acetylglucosaminyl-diphospho-decaprenol L-rhamnosyltransferase
VTINGSVLLNGSGSLQAGRATAARTVSAITVTYFTGPIFGASLRSVLEQPELRELIIVINGAEPAVRTTLAQLAKMDPRITLLDPGSNLGFARGCNLGAEAARGEYLAFINPDCVLRPGTFRDILHVLHAHANAWLVGGRLQHPDGREQRGGRRDFLTPWRGFVEMTRLDRLFPNHPYFKRLHLLEEKPLLEPARVPVVSGAFMMIPRVYFERLGGMDDNYFLHVDDSDLCLRIHLQGGEVWYAGNVSVTHHLSSSRVSRWFVEWHKTLGGCYYFKKHFTGSYPAWSLSLLSAALWVRLLITAPKIILTHARRVKVTEVVPEELTSLAECSLRQSEELAFTNAGNCLQERGGDPMRASLRARVPTHVYLGYGEPVQGITSTRDHKKN